ncbi:MAG: hypothetical protein ACUVXA_12570 [Candidatus Jordarchaeum sp.]|uniref:hypothetical protein n=1 Tax=Candidatus Jordarchaeum sp. TaxID=2823881 RepID=UPI00404ADABF
MLESEFVFKVLVVGPREEVKDRFLLSMGPDSYFLECFKSIVGVSLQVNVVKVKGRTVKVQIWDVFDSPPFKAMFHHYSKGAYGALVLLTKRIENEASKYIEEIYKYCGEIPVLVIVIEEKSSEELAKKYSESFLKDPLQSLEIISERIFDKKAEPFYLRLSYSVLPSYAQLLSQRRLENLTTVPINVPLIKETLESMGFMVNENNEVLLKNEKAIYTVDLKTGDVYVGPKYCANCDRDCVKREKVCMVLATSGWASSPDISQSDLLIISKVYAIANDELPPDVREKINEILYCPYKDSEKPKKTKSRRRRRRT